MRARNRLPRWLLAVLALGAALMFWPYVPWMTMALWLGLYARRIHAPLTRRLKGRSHLSATLTVSLLLVIALPLAALLTSIVFDTIALIQQLMASDQAHAVFVKLAQGTGSPTPSPEIEHANRQIGPIAKVIDLAMAQGDRAWSIARNLAGMAAHFVIGVLIMVTGMYGVLVDGPRWYAWLERHTPLSPDHFRRFGDAFRETGRGLWWGIFGAGMIQSLVATIAFVVLGVPSAFALGLLTLIFSVVPAIGTALVWVPVAAGLAITGRPAAAIALAIVGVGVIGTVDNLVRPYLAHRGKLLLPTWIVLTAMFGGVELMGAWGLVIGPLVVRLAKEALVISREARDPATSGPPVETSGAS